MAFLACVHLALFLALSLFFQETPLFPHGVTIASFLALKVSNSSLFSPALLRTHSLVFFAVHETRRIFLSPFISKASRRVSFFTTTTTTNYLLRVLTRLRSIITLQHQFVGGGLVALLQHVEAKATRRQSPCSWVIPLFVRTIKADS